MKRYFITGTDTDCGKTYVTRKLLQQIPNSLAIKPVASGCDLIDGDLINADAQCLQINSAVSLNTINPWRFAAPVSPHIAAREAGIQLSISELVDYCMHFTQAHCDTLFIEGAGGLLVPLNEEETWVDFLLASKIPVLLVVGMKLGCINHALLTQTALSSYGIECIGWIANQIDPKMDRFEENVTTLESKLRFPLIAKVLNNASLSVLDSLKFD
ncbi:MAG: dethiobiotin synthase [Legionella sp.]|jgi:dethiobiotin synthetase